MVNIFIAAGMFAIIVLFVALILLIEDENGAREQKLMCCFLCGALVQNMGYLFELMAPSMEEAILAIKVQYLGSIFVPLCYCWFMYYYCYAKVPVKLLRLLAGIDFCVLALVLTMDWQQYYYREVAWMTGEDGHSYLSITYGPGYPLFLICACILPYSLSIYSMIRAIVSDPERAADRKCKVILAFSILPILALLSYAAKLTRGYDPTPSVLGLTLSFVAILVWRRRTYDFRWLAAEVLLESMGDGVIAMDGQMRLISYNQAAVDIFPELAAREIGDSIFKVKDFPTGLLDGEINGEFELNGRFYESHMKPIENHGKLPEQGKLTASEQSGEEGIFGESAKQLQDKIGLQNPGRHQGYVVLLLDVTDTRNYIEEIKRVREEAERANMAKSEFLANMSHEIRTPMNAIIGLSDIIMEESVGRKMYTYAGDIRSASQNLLAIINDILDLSKVEAGKMELVMSDYHVKSVVDEIVHMMDIAASQRGILMKYEYDMTIPCRYNGDEGRIKQILINLMNNAIKFTKKGYVKITVNGVPGANEDEELLSFAVEDTGCGIREEDLEKIFENFKQVDSKRNRGAEGTGLGLSITKQLVRLMGGEIRVESVYEKGSTFIVTIPQRIVDRRTLEEVPAVRSEKEGKVELFRADGLKVLVVDDNLINRKVARSFLEHYHFEIEEAASGFDAIELVKNTKYDIIFMDHMMPEMDGIETARIIRRECGENGGEATIIALTANAMEGVREMFMENGFQDFLTKPLERRPLNEMLLKWVAPERRKPLECPEKGGKSEGEEAVVEEVGEIEAVEIDGIDMETVRRIHKGADVDYIGLLKLYCMDGQRKLPLLQELYSERNFNNYEIEVHALKSASANVGAMKLSEAAKAHEAAADNGDEAYIDEHFEELISLFDKQLQDIRSFLDAREEAPTESGEKLPEMDAASLAEGLKEALKQLESFRSRQCAEKIEELCRHQLEPDTARELSEIKNQLALYEDENAEELLKKLISRLDA